MTEGIVHLHCPTCAQALSVFSSKLDITKPMFCSRCHTYSNVADLKTASGKTLFQQSEEELRVTLKGFGGVRRKR